MAVSEATYLQLALEDPEGHWELHHGCLRQKPGMSLDHNQACHRLLISLWQQLDATEFDVRISMGHVRRSSESYYIPDVYVIPVELQEPLRGRHVLEMYQAPLPLVVEVWSPSTGGYDVEVKLQEYQQRGDLEIWRIHPYEHTLISWVRQADGSYAETQYTGGVVHPTALPGVAIDLDKLLA